MSILKDFSLSTVTAGFVSALVGLATGVTLIFEAANRLGATDAQVSSWVWALCMGMGVLTFVPSLLLRMPAMVAFSAPGAVVLATLAPGEFTLAQGIGAFILNGVAMAIVGFTGLFERFMDRIPGPLAAALLAGVIARFAVVGFVDAKTAPWLVLFATAAYLVTRRFAPAYAVVGMLAVGLLTSLASGSMQTEQLTLSLAKPIAVAPTFTLAALVGITIPLFVVTMAGQNLPGVAAYRGSGYDVPTSKMLGGTGLGTVALAPFGGFTFNLSAVMAMICVHPSTHPDPRRRYTAALAAGAFYLLAGTLGSSITGLLRAFPPELVHIVASLALAPVVTSSLTAAVREDKHRDAASLTFLVTLSGVSVGPIGSPLWGAAAGLAATALASTRFRAVLRRPSARRTEPGPTAASGVDR
ncbi:MAG: benzoate/H(+) symporter BenE family transporter [Acidimicrobiales bacterium]